jgi:hypothetical protein
MTRLEATAKAQRLIISYTDEELCKKIGITRPTLNSRVSKHNWKVSEIFLLEKLT